VVHHGKGLFLLTKNNSLVDTIKNDFRRADIGEKDIAMLAYAEKVTVNPCDATRDDIAALKQAGFKDADILDIVQVAAYYAYVNRLACGLGVELEGHRTDNPSPFGE
jgi:uncharacterized peroxidase-related enzyme